MPPAFPVVRVVEEPGEILAFLGKAHGPHGAKIWLNLKNRRIALG
jgi:hypothetical protein